MIIALILMTIVALAFAYEIGYCKGYELAIEDFKKANEEYEKFVKGKNDEEKNN